MSSFFGVLFHFWSLILSKYFRLYISGFVLASGLSLPLNAETGKKGEINIAISSVPNNLHPFFSTDYNSQNINRLVHIALVDLSKKMKFSCALCTSYSENVKEGKHYLRFKLKKEHRFWDGTTITAQDVENSVKYFSSDDPQFKSIFRFAFQNIESVKVHGMYDVELVYKSFSPENISNLVLLKILKLKAIDGSKVELENIVGGGKYRYGEISPLAIKLHPVHKEQLPILNFKVVKDETTLALKLLKGEIDLSLVGFSPRKLNWLKEQAGNKLKFWTTQSTNYYYIGLNHIKQTISNLNVRKALSYLVPRQDLLKYKMKNTVILANGFLSPSFEEYYVDMSIDPYLPHEAEKLLDEAGYKKNKEGVRFSLDWKVTNNKAAIELVHNLRKYFESAGIKVNITIQEWGTFMKSIKSGSFDAFVGQWIGFTGPEMLNFVFHSANIPPKGANRGQYKNEKLDQLLDEAVHEIQEKQRAELYKKAQVLIRSEYPYIDLWWPQVIWIARECVKGGEVWPNASFGPLENLVSECI